MKKSIFSMLLLAVAAMTTVSCSNDSEQIQEPQNKIKLSFTAGMPQVGTPTRTEFGASTGNGFKSMWSAFDEIHVLDGFDQIVGDFASTSNEPSEKATFESGMLVNYIETGIVAYHGGIGSASYNGTTLTGNFVSAQELKAGKFDSNFDVLVSKPIDGDFLFKHNNEVIPLEFARQTGIIELKVKAKQGHEGINGAKITKIVISTGDDNYDFGGEFEINVSDGKLARYNGWSKSPADPIKADLTNYLVKVGDDKSMFLCSLPTEITTDKSFTITVNAKKADGSDLTLSKKITGKKINIPAGLITKMTVSFEDPANQKGDEEVDTPEDGVSVESDVITIAKGSEDNLNGAHIKKALAAGTNRIAIDGGMSAKGMFALQKALKGLTNDKAVDLNLSNATYVTGEYKYTDERGSKKSVKLTEGLIGSYQFEGCKLSAIELPNNTARLDGYAFKDIKTLKKVVIPALVGTMENYVFEGCTGLTELYMLSNYEYYSDYGTSFLSMKHDTYAENIILYIWNYWEEDYNNYIWPEYGTLGTWFNTTWKSVIATDEHGNILQ